MSVLLPSVTLPTMSTDNVPSPTQTGTPSITASQPVSDINVFMSNFAMKHGAMSQTVHWDIKVIPTKQGVDVVTVDFLKPRQNLIETHWAHKPDFHCICFEALLQKKTS